MAGNTKADALLKAAQSGMVPKLRELLAAGAPVEARDVNRMTPVMLAAQGGHVEAFRVLVEAGADLHALAFRQLDLLEVAARGGNVEIVRLLLQRGLPVNGHWQPVNDVLRRMGHDTPLIQAVDYGHVEVVRVLLKAGADQNAKYGGKTALAQVKERLRDPDYVDEKQQYREIAALLGEVPAESDRSADSELREVEKFAKNARRSGE
jgi:ankyrin repeat protein